MSEYIDVNYILQLQNEVNDYKVELDEILRGIVNAVKGKYSSYSHYFDYDFYNEYTIKEIVNNLKNRGFNANYVGMRNNDEEYYVIDVSW